MLTKAEIDKLLQKKEVIVPDEHIMREAIDWDLQEWSVSARLVAFVYSYMKHRYQNGETLTQMERNLGVAHQGISNSLQVLEQYGYIAISRARKPFQYRVIK